MKYSLGSFKLLTSVRGLLSTQLLSTSFILLTSPPLQAQPTRTLRVVNTSIQRETNGTVPIEMAVLGNENQAAIGQR